MKIQTLSVLADVPIGKFTRPEPFGGFKEVRISKDGKTAAWVTRT